VLAWHPDGTLLVAGGHQALNFYDIPSMMLIDVIELNFDMAVTTLDFSPDGRFLATGHRDGHLRIWDPDTKQILAAMEGHTNEIYDLDYAPDGGTIASTAVGDGLTLWNLEYGISLITFPQSPHYHVKTIEFSPDGRFLAYGADTIYLNVFDRQQFKHLEPLKSKHYPEEGRTSAIAISPDNLLIAAGADRYSDRNYGHIQVWDLTNGERLVELAIRPVPVIYLEFTPNGSVLIGKNEDGQFYFWDTSSWEQLVVTILGDSNRSDNIVIAPGGRWLTMTSNRHILFVDLQEILPDYSP
jgi:WD40 repeat protein